MKIDISSKILEIQECAKKANEQKSNRLVWEPFQNDLLFRLSWNSNSLEGNTLSLEETIAVIEYDEVRSGHTYTEYQEARSMYRTVRQQLDFEGKTNLDLQWIMDTNRLIMQNGGGIRKEDVYVGTPAETVYYPPSFQKIPELIEKYTGDLSVSEKMPEAEFITHVARKHIEFERIHPFKDGNVTQRHQQKAA